MAATPKAVVLQLLRVHLGLDAVVSNSSKDAGVANIRSFRDLMQLPTLRGHTAKRALLRHAEATSCTGVLLDVLLFLSHTMTPALFTAELVKMPTALDQWVHYISEQCIVEHARVSLDALHNVLVLYSATGRYQDLASLLLSVMARASHHTTTQSSPHRLDDAPLRVARDVVAVVRHYRHKLPSYVLELVSEHIALLELELATEQHDARFAPNVCTKTAHLDKRVHGLEHQHARWHMRHIRLDAHALSYSKHDSASASARSSRNSSSSTSDSGCLALTRSTRVTTFEYNGRLSKRPHCLQVGDGSNAVVLDACTPVVQFEWVAALNANIQRLGLDAVWHRFPRRSVVGRPLASLLRYVLLYHRNSSANSAATDAATAAPWDPHALRVQFQVDDRRFYYALLRSLAVVGDWDAFERLAGVPTTTTTVTATGSPAALSHSSAALLQAAATALAAGRSGNGGGGGSSSTTLRLDPESIGYGAIVDLAIEGGAPSKVLAAVDAQLRKQEMRSATGKRVRYRAWSCRTELAAAEASAFAPRVSDYERS